MNREEVINRALGEIKVAARDIDYILISHYHPDTAKPAILKGE